MAFRRITPSEYRAAKALGWPGPVQEFADSIPVPEEVLDAEAAMHVDDYEDMLMNEEY